MSWSSWLSQVSINLAFYKGKKSGKKPALMNWKDAVIDLKYAILIESLISVYSRLTFEKQGEERQPFYL